MYVGKLGDTTFIQGFRGIRVDGAIDFAVPRGINIWTCMYLRYGSGADDNDEMRTTLAFPDQTTSSRCSSY